MRWDYPPRALPIYQESNKALSRVLWKLRLVLRAEHFQDRGDNPQGQMPNPDCPWGKG